MVRFVAVGRLLGNIWRCPKRTSEQNAVKLQYSLVNTARLFGPAAASASTGSDVLLRAISVETEASTTGDGVGWRCRDPAGITYIGESREPWGEKEVGTWLPGCSVEVERGNQCRQDRVSRLAASISDRM